MSVNAFYNAFNATQNALGDPRGDAERRKQQEMQNAMAQRQMQMREFEFGQKEQEAQRAEQARQMEARRKANRARIIGESLYPNQQPEQATPAAPMTGGVPMTGGAPLNQAVQGQSFVDDATGKEGASYTATAMSRGPMLTEDEILELEARDAFQSGDFDYFDDRINLRRQKMTEEEKRGRQQIALAAGPIIRLPTHEARVLAVKQAMQSLGISADETRIDDFFNDPQGLMLELQLAEGLGAPEDRLKENIRVGGTFEQYRPPEIKDTGDAFRAIGVMPGNAGTTIGAPVRINVSPNTRAQVGATIRGQNLTDARAGERIDLERQAVEATQQWLGGGAVSQMSDAELLAIVSASRGGR
jgi:hypothetical protein